MAKLRVYADDGSRYVEISDPSGEGEWRGDCSRRLRGHNNILAHSRARFDFNDAIEEAGRHVDHECTEGQR